MMIEPSLLEETIFAQALEFESAVERAAFLDRACGGNRTLRAEVEALLRADAQGGDLLDLPERPGSALNRLGAECAGTVIGPYTLLEEIGEGGMGTVWRAEQSQPVRRQVALKLVKAGMDSRRVIARFEAERQALALMDHPNIAKVHDAGTTACGRPYFVMELVQGAPITEFCDECGLAPRERLELFLAVCHAVQHAHQKGIIHRDLKPSNVLVALYDGRPVPKVIDFGVAKATSAALTERTTLTQHGQLVGTLEYMSPEQACFSDGDIDTRSDIYALGVLLYELLTGSTPFERERLHALAFDEMLRVIREEEPPQPSMRLSALGRSGAWNRNGSASEPTKFAGSPKPSLSTIGAHRRMEPVKLGRMIRGDLDWIVMKALEKDRDRRYATANGLALDLQRYLADEPVAACPPSVSYRMRKFVRRNKATVAAAVLVVLALVAGMLGTTWGLIRAHDARGVAVEETKRKEAALGAARRSEREAKEQLFLALLNQARAGRFSRRIGQRLESLDALRRAADIHTDERLRDEAIAAMALPDLHPVPGWSDAPHGATAAAYGGQFDLYARADGPGTISIRRIPGDREIQRIAAGVLPEFLCFSPDDRFLIGLGERSALRVWRVADGREIVRDEPCEVRAYAFSPDGRRLAVGRRDAVLCFDLATGRQTTRWPLPASAWSLAFDPDSARLAVGYKCSTDVSIYGAERGALVAELPVGHIEGQIVAWHPDGAHLAVAGSDPRIQVWNVAEKRKIAILEGHVQHVTILTFHPDGDLLASHGWDGLARLWHPLTGRPLIHLTTASFPRFSTDGRWLGITRPGEQANLFEVTASREYRTLAGSGSTGAARFDRGDISPGGRLLVVSSTEGARVYDLRSLRELAALPDEVTDFVFFEGDPSADRGTTAKNRPRWRLLTGGSKGLLRWPVTCDDPEGRHLRLGPPTRLSPLTRAWFARSPDGGTLAVATKEGGPNQILDLKTGAVRRALETHPMGEVRALSGDGRWAASCGWVSDRVRLWNVATGRMVREWVLGMRTYVFFTPDSRALIIARGDEFSFWDVQTLQPVLRLRREVAQFPGWVAFSPDGRLMALEMAPAVLHLKDAASGRTVARLEDPNGDRASWQAFTPDGTRLVVVSGLSGAIHVWDLRAIYARLKRMNLDWDWPEFASEATDTEIAEPLTIEVIPASAGGVR